MVLRASITAFTPSTNYTTPTHSPDGHHLVTIQDRARIMISVADTDGGTLYTRTYEFLTHSFGFYRLNLGANIANRPFRRYQDGALVGGFTFGELKLLLDTDTGVITLTFAGSAISGDGTVLDLAAVKRLSVAVQLDAYGGVASSPIADIPHTQIESDFGTDIPDGLYTFLGITAWTQNDTFSARFDDVEVAVDDEVLFSDTFASLPTVPPWTGLTDPPALPAPSAGETFLEVDAGTLRIRTAGIVSPAFADGGLAGGISGSLVEAVVSKTIAGVNLGQFLSSGIDHFGRVVHGYVQAGTIKYKLLTEETLAADQGQSDWVSSGVSGQSPTVILERTGRRRIHVRSSGVVYSIP